MCLSGQLNRSSILTPKHLYVPVRGIGTLFNKTELLQTLLVRLYDDPINKSFDLVG